jgi:hypothetical protein
MPVALTVSVAMNTRAFRPAPVGVSGKIVTGGAVILARKMGYPKIPVTRKLNRMG